MLRIKGLSLRKRTGLILRVIAIAVVLVSIFILSTINTPTQESSPAPNASAPTTIAGKSNYYLTSPPSFVNNTYKITKVFLVKADAYIYADTSPADIDFDVPQGMFLYIVNGTIRNDYSATEIIRLSSDGLNKCIIGIDIYLYDAQGGFINTLNRGNPLRGCSELTMRAQETSDFETVFVSSIENVDHFEVYVSYLDPMPLY